MPESVTHTCADEAAQRWAEADSLMAEHEIAGDHDRVRYNRICHLRQTAMIGAALGDRPYYADGGRKA